MPIKFNSVLSEQAKGKGFIRAENEPPPFEGPLTDANHKNRLLHLLFHLAYTKEGRNFLRANEERPGKPEAEIRATLRAKFEAFLATNPARENLDKLVSALIEGHLAADRWVKANKNDDDAKKQAQGKIYADNLKIIMDELTKDAQEDEFSMCW